MDGNLEKRSNVRAGITCEARIRGTDGRGQAFDIRCESVDYSRDGLGLLVDAAVVSTGAVVSVELPRRLSADAVVQWVGFDVSRKKARLGMRLIEPRTSFPFRVAGCTLILLAALSQAAAGKSRWGFLHPSPPARCKVGTQQMKMVIDTALAQPEMITDEEKAFVRTQHEQLSCDDYTRLFEQTSYYRSPGKREAMMKWHWEFFHSHVDDGHEAAAPGSETTLSGGR